MSRRRPPLAKTKEWIRQDWWTEETEEDFLRRPGIEDHPVRVRMGEEAAEIGGMVLDVGCCTSIDHPRVKRLGLDYVGMDIIPKFIARGRKHNPGIKLIIASALHIPVRKQCFNVVYLKDVVQHLHPDEYHLALQEAWRAADWLLLVATNRRFLDKMQIVVEIHTKDWRPGPFGNFYSWQSFTKNLRKLKGSHFKTVDGLDAPEDKLLPSICPKLPSARRYTLFIIRRIDRPSYRWKDRS